MFRLLLRFLLLVLVVSLIRYVISTVARLFSRAAKPAPQSPRSVEATAGGELKQDPVCGTFVPATTSIKKTVNGELVYFCSAACRDKFKVA